MGAGTSALHFIDGSYACLYYSLPIQHISVPRVLHTQRPTQKDTRDTHLLTYSLNVGTVQALDRGV